MTRLLERLEHLLGHTPLRHTVTPRRRSDRPTTGAPAPAAGRTGATAGFADCRGEWHAWADAS